MIIKETESLILLSSNRLWRPLGKIDLTFRLFPKKVELQALIKYYDVNGDGQISYDEFIRGLRDDLTPRRAAMVDKAFKILDFNGSG